MGPRMGLISGAPTVTYRRSQIQKPLGTFYRAKKLWRNKAGKGIRTEQRNTLNTLHKAGEHLVQGGPQEPKSKIKNPWQDYVTLQ